MVLHHARESTQVHEFIIFGVVISIKVGKSRMANVRGIHDALDKEHIIFGVVLIIKVGEFTELWTAGGYVHVSDGSLETGALWCWFEGLHNVLTVVLVHQDQRDLVVKRPLEQSIKLSLHQDKEERQVCLVSHAIAIEVDPDAHLVAILSRVEWWAVQRQHSSINSISSAALEVRDLPQK